MRCLLMVTSCPTKDAMKSHLARSCCRDVESRRNCDEVWGYFEEERVTPEKLSSPSRKEQGVVLARASEGGSNYMYRVE